MSLVAVRLCVLAMAAGEPITTVAARIGHRDLSITLRVYAHLLPGRDRLSADRFDGPRAAENRWDMRASGVWRSW